METNIMPKIFGGKSYSYYSSINTEVGDLVIAPTANGNKIARVSEVNIPEEKVISIKPYLKTITLKINKSVYIKTGRIVNVTEQIEKAA